MTRECESDRHRGLARSCRIRRQHEFQAVQARGLRVHTRHFLLLLLAHPGGRRLGLIVTKKVSKRAVERNRIKRVVRAAFRLSRGLVPAEHDVVVIAKRGAETVDCRAAIQELEQAAPAMARAVRATMGRPTVALPSRGPADKTPGSDPRRASRRQAQEQGPAQSPIGDAAAVPTGPVERPRRKP